MHEVGHCLGLGESLAVFFDKIFNGTNLPTLQDVLLNPDSVRTHPFFGDVSLGYSPVLDSFLREKVGDTAFWSKVYEGSNQNYGEMWEANLTVLDDDNIRRPLVSYDLLLMAKNLLGVNVNVNPKVIIDFVNFAGINTENNWNPNYGIATNAHVAARIRIGEIIFLFGRALGGDKEAEREVKEFFGYVEQFNDIYNGVLKTTLNSHYPYPDGFYPLINYARIFDYFKVNTQGKTTGANVDTDAGMER